MLLTPHERSGVFEKGQPIVIALRNISLLLTGNITCSLIEVNIIAKYSIFF